MKNLSIHSITPDHLEESFALLQTAQALNPTEYPLETADQSFIKLAFLTQTILNPESLSLMIRVDGTAVGQIVAYPRERSIGSPARYAFIWSLWIDPSFRRQGLMSLLFAEWKKLCRSRGLEHWEALANAELAEKLLVDPDYQTRVLQHYIGGPIAGEE